MKNIRRCTGLLMLIVGMFALGANMAIGEGLKTRALTGDNALMTGQMPKGSTPYELRAGVSSSFGVTLMSDDQIRDYSGTAQLGMTGFNTLQNGELLLPESGRFIVIGSLSYRDDLYNIILRETAGSYVYEFTSADGYQASTISVEFVHGVLVDEDIDPANVAIGNVPQGEVGLMLEIAGPNDNLEFNIVAGSVTYTDAQFTDEVDDFNPISDIVVKSSIVNSIEIKDQPAGVPATIGGGVLTSQPTIVVKDIYGNAADYAELTCVATAGDVVNGLWYTAGSSVTSTTGFFNYTNLGVYNLTDQPVPATSILFTVVDELGQPFEIVSQSLNSDILAYPAHPGNSIVMDNSWIESPNVDGWREGAFTVEFWHKPTSNVADASLFSCSSATSNVEILQTANEGELRLIVNDTTSTVQVDTIITDAYTGLNEWNYFALVFNGEGGDTSTAVAVSINGNDYNYYDFGGPKVTIPTGVYFGRRSVDNSIYFGGELDYIKLWNKALNITELRKTNVMSIVDPSEFSELIGLYYTDALDVNGELFDHSNSANHLQVTNVDANSFVTSHAQGSSTILSITEVGTDSCRVNWKNPDVITTTTDFGTSVEYSTDPTFVNDFNTSTSYSISVTSITITGLTPGATYYFRLNTVYEQGDLEESRFSESVQATTYDAGAAGAVKALEFNGQVGALAFDNPVVLDGTWTIQTWVYLNGAAEQVLLEGNDSKNIILNSASNNGNLVIQTTALNSIDTGIRLEENEWTNLAVNYNVNDQLTVYVNGLPKFSTNVTFAPTFTSIGSSTQTTSMIVDEFKVFGKTLETSEVKDGLFAPIVANADLQVAYHFNVENATTVTDNSDNGNNATFVAGTASFIASEAWNKPIAFKAENLSSDNNTYSFDAVWKGNENGYLPGDSSYSIRFGQSLDGSGNIENPVAGDDPQVVSPYHFNAEVNTVYYYQVKYKASSVWSNIVTGYTPLQAPGTALRFKEIEQTELSIPESESLRGSNLKNYTLEAWVMLEPSNDSADSVNNGIIGSKSGSLVQSAPVLGVTGDDDRDIYFGFAKDYGEDFFFTVPSALDYLQWTHLAVTYNGSEMKLYKDGELLVTETGIYSSPAASAYIGYIGALNGTTATRNVGAATTFNGQVDKVRIWNYARTIEDINDNLLTSVASDEQGLVLDYRFSGVANQDSTTVYDFSVMENHSTYIEDQGTESPWKLSLATVKPDKLAITNEKDDRFDVTPQGLVVPPQPLNYKYLLYVAKDEEFTTMLPGYDGLEITGTTTVVTGEKGIFYVKTVAFSDTVDTDSAITDGHIKGLASNVEYAITGRLPKPGNCIAFRGNGDVVKVDQTGSLFLEPKSEFTIETWVKMNHDVDPGPHTCLVSNKSSQSSNNQGFWFNVKDSSGQLLFGYNDKFHGNISTTGTKNIRDGLWHHVAVTFTTEEVNLYVDGLLDGSSSLSGEFSSVSISNTNKLTIGSSSVATTSLIGYMDEVRIWNVARTRGEISSNMNQEIDYRNVPEELVLYLLFDEESGAVARDLSANANNGVLEEFRTIDIDDDLTNDSLFNPAHLRSGAMGTIILEDITEITASSVIVNWRANTTQLIKDFTVLIATDQEFTNIVKTAEGLGANQIDLLVGDLTPKQVYYCKVQATVEDNGNDRVINSDGIQSFTTYDGISAGKALQFDGVNDRLEIAPVISPVATENFAVDMWVYIDPTQNAGYNPLFHTSTNGGIGRKDNLSFGLYVTGREIYGYAHYHNIGDVKTTLTHFTPAFQITNGEWIHYAVSWGRGDMDTSIFVNGVESNTSNSNFTAYLYDTIYVGGIPSDNNGYLNDTLAINPATNFFKGMIDELRIWESSLTEVDVKNLYGRKLSLDELPGTVAFYTDFNQGIGEVIPNFTGDYQTAVLFDGDVVANSDNTNGPTYVDSGALSKVPYLRPASDLEIDGFTLNWEPVEGASTYTVKVYDLDDNVVETITVTAPDTVAVVTGLDYAEYTYDVTVSYSDGRPDTTSEKVRVSTALPVPGYALQANNSTVATENGYFEVNDNHIFGSSPKEFSIEFWAKPTKLTNYNWEIAVMNDNTKGYATWDSFTFHAASNGWAYVGTNTGTGRIEAPDAFDYADEVRSPDNITQPMWQHFAFTYDNGDAKLYKNGKIIGTRSGMNYEQSGVWAKLRFSKIDGRLDQLRIWSKSLSQSEVINNQNVNLEPGTEDLRACYRFDQFSALADGTVPVHDYSGNGLHGKIYNGADATVVTMAQTVPSFATVKPIALPATFVEIDETLGEGKIQYSWKPSEIQPVIDRVSQTTGSDFNLGTEATYIITLSDQADFSNEIERKTVKYDGTIDAGDTFEVDVDGTFTYTSSRLRKINERFFYRVTVSENLEHVAADNPDVPYPDEPKAEFGLSRYSDNLPVSVTLDAPGNCLYNDLTWPSYVMVPFSPIAEADELTLECWAKPDEIAGAVVMISTKRFGSIDAGFNLFLEDGEVKVEFANGAVNQVIDSGIQITDGTWHHLAFTLKDGAVEVIIDGNLATAEALTFSTIPNTNGELTFLQDITLSNAIYYTGSIDEVRAWQRKLSITEINDNLVTSVATDATDLIAYYNCDQGTGELLMIDTVGLNSGTILGNNYDAWKASEAMGAPTTVEPIEIQENYFVASFLPPVTVDEVTKYEVVAADNPSFSTDDGAVVTLEISSGETSAVISELFDDNNEREIVIPGKAYFYKVVAYYNTTDGEVFRESNHQSLSTVIPNSIEPGKALDFEHISTRYTEIPFNPQFHSPEVTISTWAKFAEWGGNNGSNNFYQWGTIASLGNYKENGGKTNFTLLYKNEDMKTFQLRGDGQVNFTYPVEADRWYYITAVFGQNGSELYIDGELVGSTIKRINNVLSTDLYLGSSDGKHSFFNGSIDETRIWNYARTAAQINTDMNYSLIGDEEGLVGYYKMDNERSMFVPDMSQNANDGEVAILTSDGVNDEFNGWIDSYAMGCPQGLSAKDIEYLSFTARFGKPTTVPVEKQSAYNFEVTRSQAFAASFVDTTRSNLTTDEDIFEIPVDYLDSTSEKLEELLPGIIYYYRAYYNLEAKGGVGERLLRRSKPIEVTTRMIAPGYAADFQSDFAQYIQMENEPVLKGSALPQLTMSMWLKPLRLDGNGLPENNNRTLTGVIGGNKITGIDYTDDEGNSYTTDDNPFIGVDNADLVVSYVNNATQSKLEKIVVNNLFVNMRWYHVAVTIGLGEMVVYVDGIEATRRNVTGAIRGDKYIKYIGQACNGANVTYDGSIDELRVWNVIRTLADIRKQMYTQLDDIESFLDVDGNGHGLILYHQFNQIRGDIVYDGLPDPIRGEIVNIDEADAPVWTKNEDDLVTIVDDQFGSYSYMKRSVKLFYNQGVMALDGNGVDREDDNGFYIEDIWAPNIDYQFSINDFVVHGSVYPYSTDYMNDISYLTTNWGLDSGRLRSVQVTKQAMYVRQNFQDINGVFDVENLDQALYELTFDLRKISPAVYGYPDTRSVDFPDPAQIEAMKQRFASSTAEEYQLLWREEAVVSAADVYHDVELMYPGQNTAMPFLYKDVFGLEENDEDYYKIGFFDVPASNIVDGVVYEDGVFALGSTIPLDEMLLTPVVGIEITSKVVGDKVEISWTVEDESGVKEYLIERLNPDGTWTVVKVVKVGDEYFYVGEAGVQYRITVVDKYGVKQSYNTDSSEQTWFITLDEGWNLLSLPCEDGDISNLKKYVDSIWTWNGVGYELATDVPAAQEGFWVYNSGQERVVEVSGNAPSETTVKLDQGWNLTGPAQNCYAPANATSIYSWSSDKYNTVLQETGIMMMTRGYWMFTMEQDAEVALP